MDPKTRQKNFMYLFERVGQPLYLSTRGYGKHQILYNVPQERLEPHEAKAMVDLRKNIPPEVNPDIVTISNTIKPYDLTPVQVVPRLGIFTNFSQVHTKAADALVKIFMEQPTTAEFFNACASCRDSVNPQLWVHAYITACLFRKDMRGFAIPAGWEILPELFFQTKYIREAQRQAQLPPEDRAIIVIGKDFSGFDLNPEHKMAYWLEDLQINTHHWHWHLANPFSILPPGTPAIDRRAEMFYYMHHNMVARYNAERFCNGLNRVLPYDLSGILDEGYFSKLTLQNAGQNWGTRQERSIPKDLNRLKDHGSPFVFNLADLRRWADRIIEAIDAGFALSADGKKVNLQNDLGIGIIGDMLESSVNSVNPVYYGQNGVHNTGHLIISGMHDPDFRYKESLGIMSSTPTAIRDPAFFRWHKYIDNIFLRQKDTLPPYTKENLLWQRISIESFGVKTPSLESENSESLLTFWMETDVDLLRGLDFGRTNLNHLGPVWARVTHLQHRNFVYNIKIHNAGGSSLPGTVRIFMAPKNDEQGDPLPYSEQRILFFELDKFSVTLRPGVNTLQRRSEDSNLTIPWDQPFRVVERDLDNPTLGLEAFCGCGWPHHVLLPKGTHGGMPFDIFAIVTDGRIDAVPGTSMASGKLSETEQVGCKDSASFCGVIHQKYPDARPMNYPLDRLPLNIESTGLPPQTVAEFVKPYSNMITKEVKIFHRNVTVLREGGAPDGTRKVSIQDLTYKYLT